MEQTIREITTDLDRRAGERHFEIETRDQRARVSITWLSNVSPPDEASRFEPCAHPPVNDGAAELLLDLVGVLRANRYMVALPEPA